MIRTSRSTLLFLVCIGGLSIVQVSAAYVCSEANEIGCASCGKIAFCDANLNPTELSCGTGKVCGNSTGTGACYAVTSAEAAMCACGPTYPDYKVDPFDPNKYLMCVAAGVQYPLSCATGLIFDESVNQCVSPPTGPPTTTLPPVSCTEIGFFGQGCNAYYACIPDSSDPSKLTATEPTPCASGEVFDASAPGCVMETDVIANYEPFTCEATPVAQMDSVECNAFRICMASGAPLGEKICCNAGERFDSISMTCVPASEVPDESCPQVNECVASKLSFNCSDALASSASSSSMSSVSAISSTSPLSSTLSSASSGGSSITSSSNSSITSSSNSSLSTSPTMISSTTTAGGVPDCSTDGAFPYPGDCTKYYWCASGQYQVQICPSQMLFDKVNRYCNIASSVVC